MAVDLISTLSPSKLKADIANCMADDHRILPKSSKMLAAVAKMQGFDSLPSVFAVDAIEALLATGGFVELNRGLSGSKGTHARLYAEALMSGEMYPGTLGVSGSGIHLATTSEIEPGENKERLKHIFPRISKTAIKFSQEGDTGVIVRCLLKSAKILDHEQIKELRREFRNRAKEADIHDCGVLAAAFGIDGYKIDHSQDESWYVILNRNVLTFQNIMLNRRIQNTA